MEARLLRALTELFDTVPNVMFCVKDPEGRYVVVNQAFADRARRSPSDLVGLRATDVFPTALARSYEAQDSTVASTGHPILGRLELVLRPDGSPGWYLTNKVLLGSPGSAGARILSLSVDLEATAPGGPMAESLKGVADHIHEHYHETLPVSGLATLAGLSERQLEHRFRRVFGVTAKQYALRVRGKEAINLLLRTDLSFAEIASRCGYYDQPRLARHVKQITGLTPTQLREQLTP